MTELEKAVLIAKAEAFNEARFWHLTQRAEYAHLKDQIPPRDIELDVAYFHGYCAIYFAEQAAALRKAASDKDAG